ncbi:MAG: hypothetical protein EH225_02515 [Calditrichaeota bacterium]|nr:hypothetical protein [Calditrichota bacterium]RQW07032.1 MAG: hypothetical protein EH225_02515 [Calditrichota bacterium]
MIKTFLICHMGALGDFLLTLPVIQSLRAALPSHFFTGIGCREHLEIAVRLKLLDHIYDREARWLIPFFAGTEVPDALSHTDGAVLWMPGGESSAEILMKNASMPVVLLPIIPTANIHATRFYFNQISKHYYLRNPVQLPPLFPSSIKRGSLVLIHPGSGSPSKHYSINFYRKLESFLVDRMNCETGFILGPVETEAGLPEKLGHRLIFQPQNLFELSQLLERAVLFVGNDSGVSHLAGLMNRKAVVFYRSTDPGIWKINGSQILVIRSEQEAEAFDKFQEAFAEFLKTSEFL